MAKKVPLSKFPARQIEYLAPTALRADERNARKHPRKQIGKIKRSINEFGFTNPLLIDEAGMVLAGHGRLEAAHEMKFPSVLCIRLVGLSDHQKRALALVDNNSATSRRSTANCWPKRCATCDVTPVSSSTWN